MEVDSILCGPVLLAGGCGFEHVVRRVGFVRFLVNESWGPNQ